MLHALRGCNLTCSCTCNNRIGYIVAAQRAVAARSEGLVEAQQLRAELLRISARLNATSSPSMAASVEAASAALATSPIRQLHSHEAVTVPTNTNSASHFRTTTRVGDGPHPGSPTTPVGRRNSSTGQVALETPVALASVL